MRIVSSQISKRFLQLVSLRMKLMRRIVRRIPLTTGREYGIH